ncbi:MAG: hypothetical protein FJW39_35180, partial [Acidobacteria bacterium]|nr:hypothetical protein [Acidobacteriota bacterium]
RQDYVRSTLTRGKDGLPVVTPFAKQDSSMMSLLAQSDGLLVRPIRDPARKAGDMVKVLPFGMTIPAI